MPPSPRETPDPPDSIEPLPALEDDSDSDYDLLPLGEFDEDSDSEVVVGATIALGARQQSDEWSFAAGLEVVESVHGSFDQEDRFDSWALDEPSEEIARGVAWASSASSGTFPAAEIQPRLASEGVGTRTIPVHPVLGAALLGSGGLAMAAALVIAIGFFAGVAAAVFGPGGDVVPDDVASGAGVEAPAADAEPALPADVEPDEPPVDGDEVPLDEPLEAPMEHVVVPTEPRRAPVEAKPEPIAAAPEAEPLTPAPEPVRTEVPDAGPEVPDEPRKRGLFGRLKGKKNK